MSDPNRLASYGGPVLQLAGIGTASTQEAFNVRATTLTAGGGETVTAALVALVGAGTITGTIGGAVTAHQGNSGAQYWPVQQSGTQTVSVSAIVAHTVGANVSGDVGVSSIPPVSVGTIASVAVSAITVPALSVTSATINAGTIGSAVAQVTAGTIGSAVAQVTAGTIGSAVAQVTAATINQIPAISVGTNVSQSVSVSAMPAVSITHPTTALGASSAVLVHAPSAQTVSVASGTMSVNVNTIGSLPGVTITAGTMTVNAATVASHEVSVNNTVPVSIVFPTSSGLGSGTMVRVSVVNAPVVGITGTLGVSNPLGDGITAFPISLGSTGTQSTTFGTTSGGGRAMALAEWLVGNGNTAANSFCLFTTNTAASGDLFTLPIGSMANIGSGYSANLPFRVDGTSGAQVSWGIRMLTSGTLYAVFAQRTIA